MERLQYEWTVTYSYSESPPNRFSDEDLELLRHLGDRGLLFVCSYPGNSLEFGHRIDGAKGPIPFTNPVDDDGMYTGYVSIECSEDRRAILDAQRWSILEAYRLGLQEGTCKSIQELLTDDRAFIRSMIKDLFDKGEL